MSTQDTIRKTAIFVRNSATLKIFSIGIIVIFLLIPTSMIGSLMRERESRRDSVVREINQKWGNSQTLTGPFFSVPFKSFFKDKNDALKFNIHYLHILPENLNISGKINPRIRYRSIYEAVLYNTAIKVDDKEGRERRVYGRLKGPASQQKFPPVLDRRPLQGG